MSSTLRGRRNVVTEGLVLNLDAANIKSYIKGASTWDDLSIYNNYGQFINFNINNNYNPNNFGSIIFDGLNDRVMMSSGGDIPYQITDNLTVEAFVNPRSFSGNPNILSKASNQGYRCRFQSGGVFWVFSNFNQIQTPSNTITLNKWVHVVAVFSQTGLRAYVDGVLKASNNIPYSPLNVTSTLLNIGSFSSSEVFNGEMGLVRLYNRALNQKEILQNFNVDRFRYNL